MYDSILGTGAVLYLQALTALAILFTATFWLFVFFRTGRGRILRLILLPLLIWVVFGSLDILITARGVYDNPYWESNLPAREIFLAFGPFLGPPIAVILWISLWAGLSILFDHGTWKVLPNWFRDFTQLTIFYSLAVGHFFAFHSWVSWGQGIARLGLMPAGEINVAYFPWILLGATLAAAHTTLIRYRPSR